MGCIKTGGEEESKDTTDSLDMLIFGFWHLTQVKDMENILTSQLLPFFFTKQKQLPIRIVRVSCCPPVTGCLWIENADSMDWICPSLNR